MIKIPTWIYWVVIGVLILLLFYKCDEDESTTIKTTTRDVKLTIPEQSGKFDTPKNREELPPSEADTVFIAGQPVYLPSPLDEELKKELESTKNAYNVLLDAARKREYSEDYEDENVKINVKSSVFGKLDKNDISYTRKPVEATVKETTIEKTIIKTDPSGILLGGGLNYPLDSRPINYEVNAGVRIKKLSFVAGANTNKEITGRILIEL